MKATYITVVHLHTIMAHTHSLTHKYAHTHTCVYARVRTHAHTHTHTHTQMHIHELDYVMLRSISYVEIEIILKCLLFTL